MVRLIKPDDIFYQVNFEGTNNLKETGMCQFRVVKEDEHGIFTLTCIETNRFYITSEKELLTNYSFTKEDAITKFWIVLDDMINFHARKISELYATGKQMEKSI
jgi:hypothetical protein